MIEVFDKQISQPQGVPMNHSILPLFADLDDFCQSFEPTFNTKQLASGTIRRHRKATLVLSEVMTIIVWFQQSGYRTFKDDYRKAVCQHLRDEFPSLMSVKNNQADQLGLFSPQSLPEAERVVLSPTKAAATPKKIVWVNPASLSE